MRFLSHQNYYKLIGIDLSKQGNTSITQQINFTGELEENDGKNQNKMMQFVCFADFCLYE